MQLKQFTSLIQSKAAEETQTTVAVGATATAATAIAATATAAAAAAKTPENGAMPLARARRRGDTKRATTSATAAKTAGAKASRKRRRPQTDESDATATSPAADEAALESVAQLRLKYRKRVAERIRDRLSVVLDTTTDALQHLHLKLGPRLQYESPWRSLNWRVIEERRSSSTLIANETADRIKRPSVGSPTPPIASSQPPKRKCRRSRNIRDEYVKIRCNVLVEAPPRLPESQSCACSAAIPCVDDRCSNRAAGVECSQLSCDLASCSNRRLANNESLSLLQIFESGDRGRGVRTTSEIAEGMLVGEFAGEVLRLATHQRRTLLSIGGDGECRRATIKASDGVCSRVSAFIWATALSWTRRAAATSLAS